jgi:hypothetical protein
MAARPLLGRLAALVGASALLVLVGTIAPAPTGATMVQDNATFPRYVLLIRHAEKPADPSDIHLTKRGQERAKALPQLFVTGDDRPKPFPMPDFIFATRNTAQSQRPGETVAPLAEKLMLPVDQNFRNRLPTDPDVDDKAATKGVFDLADEILQHKKYAGKTVLICWRHGTIPDLASRLKATDHPKRWKDAVFDRVWQITYGEGGKTTFANLPQRLLPGDSAE